ncbi:hypothetical protein KC19_4G253100 [Ceratodon purpureus]|uniref:Uncharacterized protein n=1 Tax=Ceratodon purpureus TaxID=3225 RepID=A0A8T0IEY5_CERPU|nr:hypothetical protein KC19_4G253100 [Ceratodon purpureus]
METEPGEGGGAHGGCGCAPPMRRGCNGIIDQRHRIDGVGCVVWLLLLLPNQRSALSASTSHLCVSELISLFRIGRTNPHQLQYSDLFTLLVVALSSFGAPFSQVRRWFFCALHNFPQYVFF